MLSWQDKKDYYKMSYKELDEKHWQDKIKELIKEEILPGVVMGLIISLILYVTIN